MTTDPSEGGPALSVRTHARAWSSALAPRGEGFEKEPFEVWWRRVSHLIAHIDPQVAEQWIHRHWGETPYSCVPLEQLHQSLERWPTPRILEEAYIHGWELDPRHDMLVFGEAHRMGSNGHPTVSPFERNGTWDFPILLLQAPHGLRIDGSAVPDASHLLIEGHSRLRYLNAIAHLGAPAGHAQLQREHLVFVLSA